MREVFLGDEAEVGVELVEFVLNLRTLHIHFLSVDFSALAHTHLCASLAHKPRAPKCSCPRNQVDDAAACEVVEALVIEPALAPGPRQDDGVDERGKEEGDDYIG